LLCSGKASAAAASYTTSSPKPPWAAACAPRLSTARPPRRRRGRAPPRVAAPAASHPPPRRSPTSSPVGCASRSERGKRLSIWVLVCSSWEVALRASVTGLGSGIHKRIWNRWQRSSFWYRDARRPA
jgi:hypothetical protein